MVNHVLSLYYSSDLTRIFSNGEYSM